MTEWSYPHIKELFRYLDRIAHALEETPQIEIEAGPPVCPNCNTFNPEIEIHETGGSGPFATFYLEATCKTCNEVFYAAPLEWATYTQRESAEAELTQRMSVLNAANGG